MHDLAPSHAFIFYSQITMNQFYTTSDLALASTLVVSWYTIHHIQKENGKGIFYYEASHHLSDFVERYFRHNVQVEPIQYATTMKALKTNIYNIQ
ncbi:MAG: hypothetical protein ACD_71C00093G0001 [uncultured bacterium (gcode 4)]|uniref:DUF5659 domain-containing protein n=1 Tax=uncultured bacterium (gcode 4) TaxID=1234023 RepID=K1YNP2_9BACT|nr:MAG: hypothetical protein ACD_71C00093G0001 [uncultured bacterium (gcode 4)]